MSKAYDRVEWDYLEKVMGKLGFREKWINLALGYVIRIVIYSILVNRVPTDTITTERGLRQGTPFPVSVSNLCRSLLGTTKKS